MCEELIIPNKTKKNIVCIDIYKSNIDKFPDLSNCDNLKCLKINRANLSIFSINYELPFNINDFNVSLNLLTNNNFDFEKVQRKGLKLNINDNHFDYDSLPYEIKIKQLILRQNSYKYDSVNFGNVAHDNIINFVNNEYSNDLSKNIFNSQSVHLTSVNKSVLKSISLLNDIIKKNNYKVQILKVDDVLFEYNSIFNCTFNCKFRDFLEKNFILTKLHSILKITYKELFEIVWCIIVNDKNNKKNMLERLKVEIIDSNEMCFTGIFNRLVNSLVGFVEGVHVGISTKEEIQLSVQQIIFKLNNKKIEYIDSLCELKNIFKDITKDEDIDKDYINSWFEAMKDYEPEPTIIKLNNLSYLKTYNDLILDTTTKEVIGSIENQDFIFF
jgi:hypothetical protein